MKSKKIILLLIIIISIVILLNVIFNFRNKFDLNLFFQIISVFLTIGGFYLGLLLYDRFGIKGYLKQNELEKTIELYSLLKKSKYFFIHHKRLGEDNSITNGRYIYLYKIEFDKTKPILIKKVLLEKLYLDIIKIHNHHFFPENDMICDIINKFTHTNYVPYSFKERENDEDVYIINNSNILKNEEILKNKFIKLNEDFFIDIKKIIYLSNEFKDNLSNK